MYAESGFLGMCGSRRVFLTGAPGEPAGEEPELSDATFLAVTFFDRFWATPWTGIEFVF